eukprot:TRINITY_DN13625_c0_g1_i2.p1 TRINITY_DN13625_c0_g1~~TRINITY_DN13625_c0_g1_i2.p1  ORF type:complete len:414 (+),score=89.94 TRINITY_DN13625_c0_g1_i2:90-1244(+)
MCIRDSNNNNTNNHGHNHSNPNDPSYRLPVKRDRDLVAKYMRDKNEFRTKPVDNFDEAFIQRYFDPTIEVIFEGELMKYKPGVNFSFVRRWCQLTRTEFRYFKNRWSANCWDAKPLMTLDLKEIVRVSNVNYNIAKTPLEVVGKKAVQPAQPKMFQFEIYTRPKPIVSNPFTQNPHEDERRNNSNSMNRSSFLRSSSAENGPRNGRERTRDHSLGYVDSSGDQTNRSLSSSRILSKNFQKVPCTHRFPDSRDVQMTRWITQHPEVRNPMLMTSGSGKVKDRMLSTSKTGSTGATFKDTTKDFKTSKLDTKKLEFSTKWSDREKDWQEAENRLLFCSQDEKGKDKWVNFLSVLIDVDPSNQFNTTDVALSYVVYIYIFWIYCILI